MSLLYALTLLSLIYSYANSIVANNAYPHKSDGLFSSYEKHPLDLVAFFIPDDPVIFEAGAHYGEDTITMKKKWPKAKMICFEPNPNAFKKHIENTKNLPGINRQQLAVNTYNGTVTFHLCYGSTGNDPIFDGASSILEASDSMKIHYQGPKITVPCVVLDDWCKSNKIDRIDFMWLDLEGVEGQLFKSSPQILSTVKVIYAETNLYPFRVDTTQYSDLNIILVKAGFIMLSHWYYEGLQGNAIFVKKELFDKLVPNLQKQLEN